MRTIFHVVGWSIYKIQNGDKIEVAHSFECGGRVIGTHDAHNQEFTIKVQSQLGCEASMEGKRQKFNILGKEAMETDENTQREKRKASFIHPTASF